MVAEKYFLIDKIYKLCFVGFIFLQKMVEKIVWLRGGNACFLDEKENGVFLPVKAFRYLTNPGVQNMNMTGKSGSWLLGMI